MPIIYLDHNVLVGIAGQPRWGDADAELHRFLELLDQGAQISLSAWHAYELAEAADRNNVDQYCAFVDRFPFVWANNPTAIKKEELEQYLARSRGDLGRPARPFSGSVTQMWASYGTRGLVIGETFTGTVHALRDNQNAMNNVRRAVNETPRAIETARRALDAGLWERTQPVIDAAYFATILGCAATDARVTALTTDIVNVCRVCPAVAVENELSRQRVIDRFRPTRSHAADLQHAIVGLAYASGFVSDDRQLSEHCRVVSERLRLAAHLSRRVTGLPPDIGAP
jgi:hypothetical protein